MLHLVLAALQIVWSGPGYPPNVKTAPPVLVAHLPGTIVPVRGMLTLKALDGGAPVPAEWHVSPETALTFDGSAPPGANPSVPAAYIALTTYRGPATIHAQYASSYANLDAFVYDSTVAACYMGYANGIRFTDDGRADPAGTPQNSDIFVLGPSNQPRMNKFSGCTGAFVKAGSFRLHVPFGGTVIRRAKGVYFGNVRTSDWHDDFTVAPRLHPGDILIFRLHDGRVAKLVFSPPVSSAFGGPYLTGPRKGEFYDYVFFHPVKKSPHAIFQHGT